MCYTFTVFLQRRRSGCYRRNCDNDTQIRQFFAALSALVRMPLSQSISRRVLKHTRTIQVDAFARDDGLWDIDAHITDVKTRDAKFAWGVRPAGEFIHDLWLRVTIDLQLNIVDAQAVSDAVPYPDHCDTIGPAYSKLIGLNLVQGFRQGLQERLAGTAGCTHLSELALILPTAAIQAFAGDVIDTRDGASGNEQTEKPFQLDRCHALRSEGEAVARYYPRWAIRPAAKQESG